MAQNISEVSTRSRGQWPVLLQWLGITVPQNNRHGACPACGGTDRFRFDDKEGRGTWFCNNCGHGDGLDLIKQVKKIDIREAASLVSDMLNASPVSLPVTTSPARKEAAKDGKPHEWWQRQMKQTETGDSPYLVAKGLTGYKSALTRKIIRAGGREFPAGSLLLPVTDVNATMTGIQIIDTEGKALLKDSKVAGRFIAAGDWPQDPPAKIIISEGYATALTVGMLSEGWSLAALSKDNMKNVAVAVRSRWPDTQIILAGDNDFEDGKPNKGRESAVKAALTVNGWVTLPPGGLRLTGTTTVVISVFSAHAMPLRKR